MNNKRKVEMGVHMKFTSILIILLIMLVSACGRDKSAAPQPGGPPGEIDSEQGGDHEIDVAVIKVVEKRAVVGRGFEGVLGELELINWDSEHDVFLSLNDCTETVSLQVTGEKIEIHGKIRRTLEEGKVCSIVISSSDPLVEGLTLKFRVEGIANATGPDDPQTTDGVEIELAISEHTQWNAKLTANQLKLGWSEDGVRSDLHITMFNAPLSLTTVGSISERCENYTLPAIFGSHQIKLNILAHPLFPDRLKRLAMAQGYNHVQIVDEFTPSQVNAYYVNMTTGSKKRAEIVEDAIFSIVTEQRVIWSGQLGYIQLSDQSGVLISDVCQIVNNKVYLEVELIGDNGRRVNMIYDNVTRR